MQNLQFPIDFKFKIGTLANDFVATDASGHIVAYVRQKLFKLKEDIQIFSDETRTTELYRIRANQWIDFSAAYAFTDAQGNHIGKIARKGWRSLWKAAYELIDQNDELQYHIREENALLRVLEAILGEVPILGGITSYFINPSYLVTNLSGETIAKLKKKPSFWGRHFSVEKVGSMDSDDDDRIMLGLMMMILLERRRG